jgi:hypothetical protein
MNMTKSLLAAAIATLALSASPVMAKVSPEQAATLGQELTPIGALKAGNKEGTIPAWTGGMTTAPAAYKGEGTTRVDPFRTETPLFIIDGTNFTAHSDKLSPGQIALFNKYPDTFKMPVYTSHRTAAAPQFVYDGVMANATRASLTADKNGVVDSFSGVPFPIPQSGHEAIWNHTLRWIASADYKKFRNTTVYPNGKKTVGVGRAWQSYPYYDQQSDLSSFNGNVLQLMLQYDLPIRRKGEVILLRDPVNASKSPRQAWQYIPGQRRVRRAPTIAFDTPNAQFAGQSTYDDAFMFNGSPERFDWQLVGKKEMYIPYNSNRLIASAETQEGADALETPNHLNPELARYELHRVWEVKATLKEGKRHVYGQRTYYLDEDTWAAVSVDIYDGRGELWRVALASVLNAYDVPATILRGYYHMDLQNGVYALNEMDMVPLKIYQGEKDKFFTPGQVRKMSRR